MFIGNGPKAMSDQSAAGQCLHNCRINVVCIKWVHYPILSLKIYYRYYWRSWNNLIHFLKYVNAITWNLFWFFLNKSLNIYFVAYARIAKLTVVLHMTQNHADRSLNYTFIWYCRNNVNTPVNDTIMNPTVSMMCQNNAKIIHLPLAFPSLNRLDRLWNNLSVTF